MRLTPIILAAALLAGCSTDSEPVRHIVAAAPPTTAPAPRVTLPDITGPPTTTARASRSHKRTRVTIEPPWLNPSGGCGGWDALVARHFPPEQVGNACRRLMCESGGNPNAIGPQTRHGQARGLMQIMNGPLDPEHNMANAASMWRAHGWKRWTCK